MESKRVEESKTTMSQIVMPNDTNPLDNLMGGNLMRWMDIAGGICAGKHTESHVVTVSVDHVSFMNPIPVGNVVTLIAKVTRAFSSSVEIYVEVFAADIKGKQNKRCNDAYFTFVAIDDVTKKPKRIPPVLALSNEEQKLYESSLRRREFRLILGGRMKLEEAKEIKEFFLAE